MGPFGSFMIVYLSQVIMCWFCISFMSFEEGRREGGKGMNVGEGGKDGDDKNFL